MRAQLGKLKENYKTIFWRVFELWDLTGVTVKLGNL
jgi:hypothetical protein